MRKREELMIMANMIEYKCPSCDGIMTFDSQSQKMKCQYCQTEFSIEAIQSYNEALKTHTAQLSWQPPTGSEWEDDEQTHLVHYVCHSCGGEIITDKNTIATTCPYCDNQVVFDEQIQGILKPDLVIPFQIDKNAAKDALKKHFENKKLLPPLFKNENHLEEIKGIYAPYWLFDCQSEASFSYRGQRIHRYSDSQYNYTETEHFMLNRVGHMDFQKIPADGSLQLDDTLMDSLEPFDYQKATDFQSAYLAGYLAEKYDVSADDCTAKINNRIQKSIEESFRGTTTSYLGVREINRNIHFNQTHVHYALLPVWILNTTWNGEKYVFAMNGQTGKFVGDLPVDNKLYWKYFGIYFMIGTLISTFVAILFM